MSESKSNTSVFNKIPKLVIHQPVFYPALITIILSVVLALIFTDQAQSSFENVQNIVSEKGGWIYTLSVNAFIVF